MKAVYGRVAQVRDLPSQQVSRVIVEIPIEAHVPVTTLLYGRDVLVTLAPPAMKGQPYGVKGDDGAPEPTQGPPPAAQEPAGGPLARLAAIWCRDPDYRAWRARCTQRTIPSEEEARQEILVVCGVSSRRELDHSPEAKAKFDARFRQPYLAYLRLR